MWMFTNTECFLLETGYSHNRHLITITPYYVTIRYVWHNERIVKYKIVTFVKDNICIHIEYAYASRD